MRTNFIVLITIKYCIMKSLTLFMYDFDGENVPNTASKTNVPNQQTEKVQNTVKQVKKPNFWQRIKNELQAWSNKDANDSSYDDTQV
jgi:hypothetical protein